MSIAHFCRSIHDRVAKLYAVELRVGDGVREKSGRAGLARSRPNGRSPASEDGKAHAWLGPGGGALLGPASPDFAAARGRPRFGAIEKSSRGPTTLSAAAARENKKWPPRGCIHEYLSYS